MVKLKIDLSEAKCKKCGAVGQMDRHHVRSQKMWVRKFEITRGEQKKYKAFVKRYESFHAADVVNLCRDCHEWIHEEYLFLLLDYALPIHFSDYTWREANALMNVFEKFFNKWIKQND